MFRKILFAATENEKQFAFHVRYKVFVEEAKVFKKNKSSKIESDLYDDYSQLIIAFNGQKPVGTCRVQMRTDCLVNNNESYYGLAGESLYDYYPLYIKKIKLAEIARSAVLSSHRNSPVAIALWKSAILYCNSKKIDYLILMAAPNTMTNSIDDANLIYDLALKQELVHPDINLTPKINIDLKDEPIIPLFTDEEKENPEQLKFPNTIKMYFKIGCYICGKPTIIPIIKKIAIPMLLNLNELSPLIQKLFTANKYSIYFNNCENYNEEQRIQ